MKKEERTGIERVHEYIGRLTGMINMFENGEPGQKDPFSAALFKLFRESNEKTVDCYENGKPFVSTWYGNAADIYAAMGIHFINPVFDILLHMNMTQLYDLEQADKMPLSDDICSLIRLARYSVEERLHPKPTGIISMLEPCDGELMLHQSFINSEHWGGIPIFGLDPVYGTTDDDYHYFAGELRRMITFLEELSGYTFNVNNLRKVVEETNKQYSTWIEYNEFRRAIPCPDPSFQISEAFWPLTQHIRAGHPVATQLMEMVRDSAEERVAAGKGYVKDEQIRILWLDLSPQWSGQIGPWMAEEWGAVVAMDFQGYSPYTMIDTSTEESMLFGLARRSLAEVPMIRQARGNVEIMLKDMTDIINDYSINCVFFPGHMGHKDQSATIYFMRSLCRDMGVPFLPLKTSLFDERYTPVDKVKKQIDDFFSAVGFKRQSSK